MVQLGTSHEALLKTLHPIWTDMNKSRQLQCGGSISAPGKLF